MCLCVSISLSFSISFSLSLSLSISSVSLSFCLSLPPSLNLFLLFSFFIIFIYVPIPFIFLSLFYPIIIPSALECEHDDATPSLLVKNLPLDVEVRIRIGDEMLIQGNSFQTFKGLEMRENRIEMNSI